MYCANEIKFKLNKLYLRSSIVALVIEILVFLPLKRHDLVENNQQHRSKEGK